jgi:hypothetical protein
MTNIWYQRCTVVCAIKEESERTRHKVYMFGFEYEGKNAKGRTVRRSTRFKAPSPSTVKPKESRVYSGSGKHKELTEEQANERRERVNRMASLVETVGEANCESQDVSLAEVIGPPVHMRMADADQSVVTCLLPVPVVDE